MLMIEDDEKQVRLRIAHRGRSPLRVWVYDEFIKRGGVQADKAWEVRHHAPEVQAVVDALNLLIPFIEDEWNGSRGCLMPTCQSPYDGHHAPKCPIGIALAARDGYQARFPRRNES